MAARCWWPPWSPGWWRTPWARWGVPRPGCSAGMAVAFATYFLVVRPIQRSRSIPREETELFVLTGTLLWGIMLQEAVAYFTTTSPHTVRPLIAGVTEIAGVRTPDQRDPDRRAVLGHHWGAVAAGEPDQGRQGVAGRFHQPTRADLAGLRTVQHPPPGLGDLRRAGGRCRRAAGRVPRACRRTMPARSRRPPSPSSCWAAWAACRARWWRPIASATWRRSPPT